VYLHIAIGVFLCVLSNMVAAENLSDDSVGSNNKRFIPYEPSFVLPLQASRTFAGQSDDAAVEGQFSFQYIILNCNFSYDPSELCTRNADTFETSLSYSGELDFYFGTRESGPVINRISNPALNLSWKLESERWKSERWAISKLGASVEHRSNGQVIDADEVITDALSPDFGQFITQLEFENDNLEYFDTLSRGANYVTLKANFHLGQDASEKILCDRTIYCADFFASYKLYWSDDSNITWGELAGTSTNIEDYDRFRLTMSNTFDFFSTRHPVTLEFDYTMGNEFFDTDSIDVNVITPITYRGLNLPLVFRYHRGPMDRLSDYTREYDSFGIGLFLY